MSTHKRVSGDYTIQSTNGGNITLAGNTVVVDNDSLIVSQSKTPATATSPGTAGEIAWDSDYVYVCVATDTWKRSPLSSWP